MLTTSNASRSTVVVRFVNDKDPPESHFKLLQEAVIRCQFSHPRVQRICGFIENHALGHVVLLEWCEHGRLDRYLRRSHIDPEQLVRTFCSASLAQPNSYACLAMSSKLSITYLSVTTWLGYVSLILFQTAKVVGCLCANHSCHC